MRNAVRDWHPRSLDFCCVPGPGGSVRSTARALEMTEAMLSETGIADAGKDPHAPWKTIAKSRSERCFVGAVLAPALRAAAGRDWRHALRPWR